MFILFATSRESFYTPYLAHLTLPEKNCVKTDQTVPSGQEWSDLCYSISSDRIIVFKGNVKVANSDNTDQILLREPSLLDYLFAISSQPFNPVLDSECNFPEHIVLT